MANFNEAHKIVMKNEGGYANHPLDRGGETYKGIARKLHPDWEGWKIINQVNDDLDKIDWHGKSRIDILNKTLADNPTLQGLVLSFFKKVFWDDMNLDFVNNQSIALELYDTGVNMGTGAAGIFLQRAINVTTKTELFKDGRIGNKTLQALNDHDKPNNILKILNCLQGAKYVAIAENNPSQEVFMNSWLSRVS